MRTQLLFLLALFSLAAFGQQKPYLEISGNDTIAGWRLDGTDSITYSLNEKTVFKTAVSTIIYQYRVGPNKDGTLYFPNNSKKVVANKNGAKDEIIYLNGFRHYSEHRTDFNLTQVRYCQNGIDTSGFYWLNDNPKRAEFDFNYTHQDEVIMAHYSPYYPPASVFWLKDTKGNMRKGVTFYEKTVSDEEAFKPKKERESLESRFSTIYPNQNNEVEYKPENVNFMWAELIGFDSIYPTIYFEELGWSEYNYSSRAWRRETKVQKLIGKGDTILTEYYSNAERWYNQPWQKKIVNHKTGEESFEIITSWFSLPNVNAIFKVKPDVISTITANDHWYHLPKKSKYRFEKQDVDSSLFKFICITINGKAERFDEVLFDSLRMYLEPFPTFVLHIENGTIESVLVDDKLELTEEWIGKREHPLLWLLNKKLMVDYKELSLVGGNWEVTKSIHDDTISDDLKICKPVEEHYMTCKTITIECPK